MLMQMMLTELESLKVRISEFSRYSGQFSDVDSASEARKYVGGLEDLYDEVEEGLKRRLAELESDLERADSYGTFYQVVMTWMPKAEEKLESMALIAANPRSVRIQIEEFKVIYCVLRLFHPTSNQFFKEM